MTEPGSEPTASQLANAGLKAQRAGDLEGAESLYRRSLQLDNNNADVLHMLGVVRMENGDVVEALRLIRDAGEKTRWQYDAFRHNWLIAATRYLQSFPVTHLEKRRATSELLRENRAQVRSPEQPLVSVLVPCYNHDAFVEHALESVFEQTYRNIEVIVIDDGSRDGSVEILRRLQTKSPFAYRFVARENRGAHATINELIAMANGAYVNILNSDDAFSRDRIESMVSGVHRTGGRWGFSLCRFIDASGQEIDRADARTAVLHHSTHLLRIAQSCGPLFLRMNPMISSGNLFVEKSLLREIGGMAALRYNHDWKAALDLLWHDEPIIVDAEHYIYRLHGSNTINESAERARQEAAGLLEEYLARARGGTSPMNPLAPHAPTDDATLLTAEMLSHGSSIVGGALSLFQERLDQLDACKQSANYDFAGDVHYIGFVRGLNGLGENLRLLARATAESGLEATASEVFAPGLSRTSSSIKLTDVESADISVIALNPDAIDLLKERVSPQFRALYNVGYWYWELEKMPENWRDASYTFDEIWVATEFVRHAILNTFEHLKNRVYVLPPPIVPSRETTGRGRVDFGLPEHDFVFHFSFDFGSYVERKNPLGVAQAFMRAFPLGTEPVTLVLKSSRSSIAPEPARAFRSLIARDRRIHWIDRSMSRAELLDLQRAVDCYVSLHRSEGLGLGMAEHMVLGKPIIATRYSGNLDFTLEENSLLTDWNPRELREGDYVQGLEWRNQFWAEPSVEHAAQHMRALAFDRARAQALGLAGQKTIFDRYSLKVCGEAIANRVSEIRAWLGKNKPNPRSIFVPRHDRWLDRLTAESTLD